MKMVRSIALNTFRESIRSKILYSIFFFAGAVVLVSALFGTVTIGDQVKVVKDFGLFSISLFSVMYAVISGSTLLEKELAKKTIYNILSRPVPRWQFLFGKYLGMLLTAALMVCLMGFGLSLFLYFFEGAFDILMFQGYFFILLELTVICGAAIFFSAVVVTPLLTGLFTFSLFLAGRSTEYLLYFVNHGEVKGALASILEGLYVVLPHLNRLNASNLVVYGESYSGEYALWSIAYTVAYTGILLALANVIFKYREFN